ncbi:hypothetical protein QUA82_10765 [Microcoleus sp. F8-D3]
MLCQLWFSGRAVCREPLIARQSNVFPSNSTFEPAIELAVEPGTVKRATDDASNNSCIHHRVPIVQPTNPINAFLPI